MEKTGYLGPAGSYSRLAAEKLCPTSELVAYPSFPLVISSLVSGESDGIVLPIENTLNGAVLQNIDLLQSTPDIMAVGECVIKIEHRLVTLKGASLGGIKRIYSHSQALEQCSKYLGEKFPAAELVPVRSTAACLDLIKNSSEAGIVGSHIKCGNFCLSTENIADDDHNFTHFLLVKKVLKGFDGKSDKIYFSVTCPNRSGALVGLLQRIAGFGLNMTKIESRPVKNTPDEYRFFIETEGDYSAEEIKLAIEDVKKNSLSFKLLGCY